MENKDYISLAEMAVELNVTARYLYAFFYYSDFFYDVFFRKKIQKGIKPQWCSNINFDFKKVYKELKEKRQNKGKKCPFIFTFQRRLCTKNCQNCNIYKLVSYCKSINLDCLKCKEYEKYESLHEKYYQPSYLTFDGKKNLIKTTEKIIISKGCNIKNITQFLEEI